MSKSISPNTRFYLPTLFVFFCFLFVSPRLNSQDLDVPYVPTPNEVVSKMLDLAEVQPDDYVIDLGSGDGRIVIAAAKRGAMGHGIDLDPQRIAEARANAKEAGVDDKVMFRQEDIFKTNFSKASVITMYLLPSVNKKLRPRLLNELKPGTRIVSHSFDMGDWEPDKTAEISAGNTSRTHDIYYWVIPADVAGTWSWTTDGTDFTLNIDQKYQKITPTLTDSDGTTYEILNKELQGDRIAIQAGNEDELYNFSGRVMGDTIKGKAQHHTADGKELSTWTATRE